MIEKDGYLYLYYLGQDEMGTQRLGVARSPDGISWQRSPANPIPDVGAYDAFDENGLGEPSVAYVPPYFYMIYTGRSRTETRNLGYAVSTDGTHWKKISFHRLLPAHQLPPWTSQVVCDSTLLEETPGKWRVWFGGGDKPEPTQNLNGQIGLATVDFPQLPDPGGFDANSDWAKTPFSPTDIFRRSFPLEGDANRRFSWIGPQSRLTLAVGPDKRNRTLTVKGWMPATMISNALKFDRKTRLSVLVNGKEVAAREFETDEAFTLQVPWSAVSAALGSARFADIELCASRSFVPAESGLGDDKRRLALTIQSIKFQES